MELLLKNSEGKPSLSFTMVYTSFLACLLWFLLSIFKIQHVKDFDVTRTTVKSKTCPSCSNNLKSPFSIDCIVSKIFLSLLSKIWLS